MDKTHLKVRGHWMYRYRAVDRDGETLDFMPFESRDTAAAKQFFAEALANKGIPLQIVVDKTVPLAAKSVFIPRSSIFFKLLTQPVHKDLDLWSYRFFGNRLH